MSTTQDRLQKIKDTLAQYEEGAATTYIEFVYYAHSPITKEDIREYKQFITPAMRCFQETVKKIERGAK